MHKSKSKTAEFLIMWFTLALPDLPHPLPPQRVSGARLHTADTRCPYLWSPDSVAHIHI